MSDVAQPQRVATNAGLPHKVACVAQHPGLTAELARCSCITARCTRGKSGDENSTHQLLRDGPGFSKQSDVSRPRPKYAHSPCSYGTCSRIFLFHACGTSLTQTHLRLCFWCRHCNWLDRPRLCCVWLGLNLDKVPAKVMTGRPAPAPLRLERHWGQGLSVACQKLTAMVVCLRLPSSSILPST